METVKKTKLQIGQKIERWTILGDCITMENGQKKWLCQCECGTQRYVLERALLYGGSQSCGCLRKEKVNKALAISDIEGKTFGELTVLYKAQKQKKNGGIWWTCQCSCGNLYDVSGSLLINGRRTHCSSRKHERKSNATDITGQRFHRLVALYPTKERDQRQSVIWHCRCDCGNEIDISYNQLVHSNEKSCGCQKKEHSMRLKNYLTHVAGTSVDILMSEKIPTNNTTGAKGVYFVRGKWLAKIVFQKKAYHLGFYEEFAEAVEARKEAEELIHQGTLEHYNKWKAKAEENPEWGENNPIEIYVEKNSGKGISIQFFPKM